MGCPHTLPHISKPPPTLLQKTNFYFISNSRFSVRLSPILINCMFKCLKNAERREKGSSFPQGYWEAREKAIPNRGKGFPFSAVSGNTPQLCNNRSPVL